MTFKASMVIKTKSPEKILRSLSKELINVRTYIVGLCPCAYAETPAKAYEARRNKRLAEIKKPAFAKSSGGRSREDRIRTCDPLVPNQVR